jgi:hypothetical protein
MTLLAATVARWRSICNDSAMQTAVLMCPHLCLLSCRCRQSTARQIGDVSCRQLNCPSNEQLGCMSLSVPARFHPERDRARAVHGTSLTHPRGRTVTAQLCSSRLISAAEWAHSESRTMAHVRSGNTSSSNEHTSNTAHVPRNARSTVPT